VIAVDLDDTLNNLLDSWLAWINVRYDKDITIDRVRRWKDIKELPAVGEEVFDFLCADNYKHIPPKPKARWLLEELYKYDEVKIITASPEKNYEFKREYIDKHFGDYELICDYHKHKHLSSGDILVDDGFHNIYPAIKEAGAVGILYNDGGRLEYADYIMQHQDFYRARDYFQILEVIEKRYK